MVTMSSPKLQQSFQSSLAFPLSNSRQLPPPINTSNLHHFTATHFHLQRQQPSEPYPHHHSAGDYFPGSYSSPGSGPSSAAASPAPPAAARLAQSEPLPRRSSRTTVKKTSIQNLLSTSPESYGSSGENSVASSPCSWSAASSPTTTAPGSTRRNSLVSTPLSGITSNDLARRESLRGIDDADFFHEINANGGKRKSRSSPRASTAVNASPNGSDEYDVLGRKKPKTPRTPMSWDPKDDVILRQLKEEQKLGWKEIATHFTGRTSHACQFRWRRLKDDKLKYYKGHRRPPPVTTTSSSFANEMAITATVSSATSTPKVLMSGINSLSPAPSTTPSTPKPHFSHTHYVFPDALGRASHIHGSSWSMSPYTTNQMQTFQPTPLPSPASSSPLFLDDSPIEIWSAEEDALLVDRTRSFNEVNVLLRGRSEKDITDRMARLRAEMWSQSGSQDVRRSSGSDQWTPCRETNYFRSPGPEMR